MILTLRDYQSNWLVQLRQGHGEVVADYRRGVGKTVTLLALAEELCDRFPQDVVVVWLLNRPQVSYVADLWRKHVGTPPPPNLKFDWSVGFGGTNPLGRYAGLTARHLVDQPNLQFWAEPTFHHLTFFAGVV